MENKDINPARILRVSVGYWAASILATGVEYSVFTHIEEGVSTADDIAEKSNISKRGALALLDGLEGLGFITSEGDKYKNTPDVSFFLVKGKPHYLGDFVSSHIKMMPHWIHLPEAVKTGKSPDTSQDDDPAFMKELVMGLVPLAFQTGQGTAEKLGIANSGPISILDLGGGSGAFSAAWLKANPDANSTQVDLPDINNVAKPVVGKFGVADRFNFLDGDYRELDLGENSYNYVICSNIFHQHSPDDVVKIMTKCRQALKPNGTMVIAEFMLTPDRQGHPFAKMFDADMLLMTDAGGRWVETDYRNWLKQTGFEDVSVNPIPDSATTLIYAK